MAASITERASRMGSVGFLLGSFTFLVFNLCMSHHARQMQALLRGMMIQTLRITP